MKFIYSYQLLVRLSGRGTCRKKDHEALPLCLLLRLPPKKWSLVSVLSSFSLLRLLSISIRDCQQITFVTLNRFCLLYYVKQTPPPLTRPPVLNRISRWIQNSNQNQVKKYTPFLHCISSFEGTKICKMSHQILYFLLFYTSLYISRHHFSQIFRTSLNIILKKDFHHKFSFFNRFITQASPLHSLNP